jgi:signal transduction histidine kinase
MASSSLPVLTRSARSTFQQALTGAVGMPILLMIVLACALAWQVNSLLAAAALVEHSDKVIAQAHVVQELMLDQETGLRGYLLTGNVAFREPYDRAHAGIDVALLQLVQAVADNSAQQERVNAVTMQAAGWQQFATETLALYDADDDFLAPVRAGVGKVQMDAIRFTITELITNEALLRDARSRNAQQMSRLVLWGGALTVTIAGSLLALVARRQLKDLAGRYEIALRASTEQAEALRLSEQRYRERSEELSHVTAQLRERNRDLDEFAYAASHDLRAPLRGIGNLAQWIEEDLGSTLNAEGRSHLELMRNRVQRLETLIDGILQYSRVGRTQRTIEAVAVGPLLNDVIDLLAPPERFTVTVAPIMPTVAADRVQLQQVFANLISNAMKHHQREDGQIMVGVIDDGKLYRFSVADDGPGIASEYHERIFGIFQTLAPRDKVEGSGLGLAIVRRIVEQQGGTIWVESASGQGSTFFFTWPKAETNAGR